MSWSICISIQLKAYMSAVFAVVTERSLWSGFGPYCFVVSFSMTQWLISWFFGFSVLLLSKFYHGSIFDSCNSIAKLFGISIVYTSSNVLFVTCTVFNDSVPPKIIYKDTGLNAQSFIFNQIYVISITNDGINSVFVLLTEDFFLLVLLLASGHSFGWTIELCSEIKINKLQKNIRGCWFID